MSRTDNIDPGSIDVTTSEWVTRREPDPTIIMHKPDIPPPPSSPEVLLYRAEQRLALAAYKSDMARAYALGWGGSRQW